MDALERSREKFAFDLADRHIDCLGLVTLELIRGAIRQGRLAHLDYNGQDGGFLIYNRIPDGWQIYYTVVEPDIRRLLNASALVSLLAIDCLLTGGRVIRLWCAADLEANRFWTALGGEPVIMDRGRSRRGRQRILYRIDPRAFVTSRHMQDLRPCNNSATQLSDSSHSVVLTLPATSVLSLATPRRLESLSSFHDRLLISHLPKLRSNNVAAWQRLYRTGTTFNPRTKHRGPLSLLPSLSAAADTISLLRCPSALTMQLSQRRQKRLESQLQLQR
jgi:hypothetical protein